jgi:hypothetical protein
VYGSDTINTPLRDHESSSKFADIAEEGNISVFGITGIAIDSLTASFQFINVSSLRYCSIVIMFKLFLDCDKISHLRS